MQSPNANGKKDRDQPEKFFYGQRVHITLLGKVGQSKSLRSPRAAAGTMRTTITPSSISVPFIANSWVVNICHVSRLTSCSIDQDKKRATRIAMAAPTTPNS